uniref:NADH-ubiquinone oxidoreductase chain 6 n=1 Tax=Vertebrata lanosa TaxID=1261582 RepID=A0A1J0F7J0_9FLOR|nr:NADH dehydrogenase subunit 6 [Vertebrata lanosa]APC24948.1 NADH dehydrogenase subunit 6 [Vertebrata lanosa]
MLTENYLFYIFYIFIVCSSSLVILSENAVYSVLFLILTFCNVVFLLLLMGAEFISFLLIIVYVGAIAVLFLFVVMMLNVKKSTKNWNFLLIYYFPLFFIIFLLLIDYFWNLFFVFDILNNIKINLKFTNWLSELLIVSNVESIGNVFYTNYCFLFLIAGCVLLIAMIGVIVLTIHQKTGFLMKKQLINSQLTRNSKKIIKFINLRKNN